MNRTDKIIFLSNGPKDTAISHNSIIMGQSLGSRVKALGIIAICPTQPKQAESGWLFSLLVFFSLIIRHWKSNPRDSSLFCLGYSCYFMPPRSSLRSLINRLAPHSRSTSHSMPPLDASKPNESHLSLSFGGNSIRQ